MDPYSPPQSNTELPPEPVTRKRWVAVLLALLSPAVAMLYVARWKRAALYFAISILSVPATFLLPMVVGVLGTVVSVGIAMLLPLVGAIDSYRLARAWKNRAPLPWFARWPALVACVVVLYLCVFSLRVFVAEPFKIPASSMEPTLLVGDYIVVSKTAYGWNLPGTSRRIMHFGQPQRGDVIVFRYPQDRSLDYVKRVVGIPGDMVSYYNKRLSINGHEVITTAERVEMTSAEAAAMRQRRYRETLGTTVHSILINPDQPTYFSAMVKQYPGRENCELGDEGLRCKVPEGHYFVMGDNRDSSSDSRYWGFVPDADILGRAVVIWYSSKHPERAGTAIE